MITILCAGSRGDFQPYIALAQQLKKLGEPVKIAGANDAEELIKSYGIDFFPIQVDFNKLGVDPNVLKDARSSDNPLKMLLTFNKMKNYGAKIAEETYASLEGSDLIVYHPGCTIGYFAAQEMQIPSVLATPFPMHKTSEYLSVILYGKTKSNRVNKWISYRLIQSMLWMASSATVKEYWKKQFGRLPDNFKPTYENLSIHHPAVVSCSNFVFKRPSDWQTHIHQYGYWFVDEEDEYVPQQELIDFLKDGEKPIYIGFGSMFSVEEKDFLVQLIIEAMNKCGKKAIISGMGRIENLPDHLIAVNDIPHSWLFQQVCVICHHGGAGTTAAGFKSGVPSVIIPFSNDQFAWAHRAYDLGVAPQPIYRKHLTTEKLVISIQAALSDELVINARLLAEKLATENGAKACAEIIAQTLH